MKKTMTPRMTLAPDIAKVLKQTTKLAVKVDRDTRMDCALLVKEPLHPSKREYTFVPDVRVDVQTLLSIEAKADELLWRNVAPGQC
ncbi:hypothetical protein PQR75_38605 [Paraburkholderia fungorum]|uniref:hypothetical protein n=1 Tax=Paraburkholderia fungorum TaxID=134537 RepID=UPI0038BD5662